MEMTNFDKKRTSLVLIFIYGFSLSEFVLATNPDKQCFPTTSIREIPPSHIFHKLKKPIVIGHRGNILSYQENTIEGFQNLIDIGVLGIHMDARITGDETLVTFHDDNLKRLTSEDFAVSKLPFSEIQKMTLLQSVKYSASSTKRYSRSLKIPLLVSALEAVRDKGRLIYIEMNPSNIPPANPRDRYISLVTGRKVAEMIRDMKLEDQVILVSRDPFKLVSAMYTNPNLVVDWWFGEEIFSPAVGDRMRKEFVDLPGLRDCYVKTAPLSAEKFAEFVVESGVVSKSVNTSLVDLDIDIFDDPKYFSGRTDKTMQLIRQNYNKDTSFGAFDVYNAAMVNFTTRYHKKLEDLIKAGLSRIVTDDVQKTTTVLNRALKTTGASALLAHNSLLALCLCSVLALIGFHPSS